MPVTGFNHITLKVAKLERSLPFYIDILGMKLVHRGATDVYLEWGCAWICLLERPSDEHGRLSASDEMGGMDHMAFSISEDDFSDAVKQLQTAGIPLVRGPIHRGGGWSVNFLDPDGIELELFTGTLEDRMKVWK
ncbi:VOC family protein [Paenibacillus sp. UNC451MF]|uniref:VOC family protein n=1 Tax=Paenibacillus sp. UNC451MF TaxID=1449063 RepID=UPI00048DE803|nr:VOC family protein [Paenibacillus sp. UNC451MF]